MKRVLLWVIVLAVLVALALPAAAQGYTPIFEPGACPFPSLDRVSCGTLIVPESRANPGGSEVELAVAIITAANGSPTPDPVIYLEGGPGGAAVLAVEDFLVHPMSQTRDLILIDQRGTGFSQPSLNCYEMEEEDADEFALEDCYNRLVDEGVNVSAYNSTESAADINDLRLALGYEQVNLWGISYGTRLALEVMRNHPQGIRAVVIDSVYPPEVNPTESANNDTIGAFNALFAACAADPVCASEYPNLAGTFYALVDAFNNNPPLFMYFDGFEEYELELFGDDIASALLQSLYDSSVAAMLPYGITLLAEADSDEFFLTDGYDIVSGYYTPEAWLGEGDFEELPESVMESDMVLDYFDEYGDISDSEGMFTSVTCSEEVVFENEDTAYSLAEAGPPALVDWLLGSVDSGFFDCEIWRVTASNPITNTRVQSNIPTLIISGGFDPVTPPSWGDSALAGLPNGQHVVFPFGGHSETGNAGCGATIAVSFLSNPGAPVNTACVPQRVNWYTE